MVLPPIDSKLWWARIHAAERLWKYEKPLWDRLEDAVDGKYPDIGDDTTEDAEEALDSLIAGRARSSGQLDVNLMGQAFKHYLGIGFDRDPSYRWVDTGSDDSDAIRGLEVLTRKLAENGKATKAGRDGMAHSMTRGSMVLWPIVERNTVGARELEGGAMPPAAIVETALRGQWDGTIPPGVDCQGVISACDAVLFEPRLVMGMKEESVQAVEALRMVAEKRCKEELKPPHPIGLDSKIRWIALAYGEWFLADSTVSDYEMCGWVQRKVILTESEFQADDTFTAEAKRSIRPNAVAASDKGVPVTTSSTMESGVATTSATKAVEEEGRVVLREVWDKVGRRRFFLADTYDGIVSKETTPLYMGADGKPLFPDFFPCSFRTPVQRARLLASRLLGKPALEDGWAPQIGYIEALSAYARAAKNTIRVAVAGPNVDSATLTEWKNAKDSTCIRMDPNAPKDTNPAQQFQQLPMPPVPMELLQSADVFLSTFCSQVRINRATITGDPIAPTATQERISVAGAGVAQSDVIKSWEDGYSEAIFKGVLIFLSSANQQQFEAFMGQKALAPRPSKMPPQQDPTTGAMVEPPPLPSIVDTIKSMNLLGARLVCRFDSSTRAENEMRLKQIMDAINTANVVRDKTMTPYVDLKSLLLTLFREMDVEVKDYEPSEAELMAMSQPQPEAGGDTQEGGDPKPGGPRNDTRSANGRRGPPPSPGRQERHKAPESSGSMNGQQIRRATAPA